MNVRHPLRSERRIDRRPRNPCESGGQDTGVIERGAREQRIIVGSACDDVARAEQAQSARLLLGLVAVKRERRLRAEVLPERRMVVDS